MDAARESAAGSARPAVVWGLMSAVAALLGWAICFGGDSGNDSVPWLGGVATVVATAALVCVLLGVLPVPRLDRPGRAAVVAGLALVAWCGLTMWWSIAGDRSWQALDKGLVYVAFGVLGLVLAGLGGRAVRDLAFLLAAVLGAAFVWALAGKAIPTLGPVDAERVARLEAPVGYWNALALLAGAAIPLGLWLAIGIRDRLARAAGVLLVYTATLTILLTQSRAGVGAGIAVTVLWLTLTEARVEGAMVALLAAAPAAVVAGWAFTRPALVEDGGSRADRVADGRVLGALVVAGALVALALVLRAPLEQLAATRRREVVRALTTGVALLAAVGAIGLVATVGNPFSWAADQIGGKGEVINDPHRFGSLQTNNRIAWWGEAWQVFRAHQGGGSGAATFAIARTRYRDDGSFVQEPHSVPMQLLSDTGATGFALALALAAALALAVRGGLRRLDGAGRAAGAALIGLPVAWGLHALVDYDLDFLAVTAPATLVTLALVGSGPPRPRRRGSLAIAAGVVLAGSATVYALAAPALADRKLDTAYREVDAGSYARAAASARSAQGLNPLSYEPLWARATVASRTGDDAAAVDFYERAVRLQPENSATWVEFGIFSQANGDQCAAYFALNQAYTLDPKNTFWYPGGPLDRARDAVNNGACEPQG